MNAAPSTASSMGIDRRSAGRPMGKAARAGDEQADRDDAQAPRRLRLSEGSSVPSGGVAGERSRNEGDAGVWLSESVGAPGDPVKGVERQVVAGEADFRECASSVNSWMAPSCMRST